MLQEISPTTGSEAPTTCRCADCPFPEFIMRPSSYRISIEKRVVIDGKYYSLPYEPIAPLSKVLMSGRGPRGQYGFGKGGQEWFQELQKRIRLYKSRAEKPSRSMVAILATADHRTTSLGKSPDSYSEGIPKLCRYRG